MSLSCFPPAFSLFFCFSFLFFFYVFAVLVFWCQRRRRSPSWKWLLLVWRLPRETSCPQHSVWPKPAAKEDPSLLHNCQRRLPPPSPCLRKLLDGIERVAKSGDRFSPSPSSHPEQASVARGKDSTCPQGAHTHTHTYTIPTHMLLSCSLPFLMLKPRVEIRSVTRQSLWQVAALGTSQGLLEDLVSEVCLHSCSLFIFALTCWALLGFWKEKRWLKEV